MKLLFVCMGNICRSPTAEAVMRAKIAAEGWSDRITCDSAGTIDFHAGSPSDARMRRHAARRGYTLDGRARGVMADDFEAFDMILCMDEENLADLQARAPSAEGFEKVQLLMEYGNRPGVREVPDPYYGGPQGFEEVLDLVEDACRGLLEHLKTLHDPRAG